MRAHPPTSSLRLIVIAASAAGLIVSACTATDPPSSERARAEEPSEEGLAEELEEQQQLADERLDALEAATAAGTVGIVEAVRRAPAPGWAGERVVHRTGNDWEPAVATDPTRRSSTSSTTATAVRMHAPTTAPTPP